MKLFTYYIRHSFDEYTIFLKIKFFGTLKKNFYKLFCNQFFFKVQNSLKEKFVNNYNTK